MSNSSVRLSKKEQIEQRRATVLELSSRGLSQQEISEKLQGIKGISQQTVSRDLEWLENNAIEYVKKNRQQMAVEYRKTLTNLIHLRKLIWQHFENANKPNEEQDDLKIALYPIIQDVEQSIHNVLSGGYHIEAEIIKYGKEQNTELEEKMNKAIGKSQY